MGDLAVRSIIVSLLLAAVACGGRDPATQPDGSGGRDGSSTSYDGTWELVEGRGTQGEVPIVDDYRITLTIEGGSVGGTSGCNSYFGDASIDGSSFELSGVGMTEIGCSRDVMESEDAYVAALQAAEKISRSGDNLTLTGTDTELRFEIEPPVPTADLIDTPWALESLIYGTGNDGAVGSAEPAELLLKSDGTISGTTGCRELYGEWTENGDEILFTRFGVEGNCSDEIREQHDHVIGVLGDGFAPTIEGDRLTLIDRGGLGLVYRTSK